MKRKYKNYVLSLALFVMFGLSLSFSFNANALKHEYIGIPLLNPRVTMCVSTNPDTGLKEIVRDYSECLSSTGLSNAWFDFPSNSYSFYMSWVGPTSNITSVSGISQFSGSSSSFGSVSISSSGNCTMGNTGASVGYTGSVIPIIGNFGRSTSATDYTEYYFSSDLNSRYFIPEFINSTGKFDNCHRRLPFGAEATATTPAVPAFDWTSIPVGNLACSLDNGAVCPGLWDIHNYVRNQLLPYSYSYDGFYTRSTAIDTETGVHYNSSFSFNDLFNSIPNKFYKLQLPLYTYDDYFFTASNLTMNREFEFKGAFEFDDGFTWNPELPSSSYFRLYYIGYAPSGSRLSSPDYNYVNCTTNLVSVSELSYIHLEYSCKLQLPKNYSLIIPWLSIYAGDVSDFSSPDNAWLWNTNDDWRFAGVFLVTDNDETTGSSFNSNLTGGSTIPGSSSVPSDGDADFFSSLLNLFNFSVTNPFSPLFALFTNGNSCVNIPTISGMLGSNETEYCSWFDSSTRSVLTPILGLSSAMIIFGFFVRWLGSSSGNFFEDSSKEVISNVNHSGFRRYKK